MREVLFLGSESAKFADGLRLSGRNGLTGADRKPGADSKGAMNFSALRVATGISLSLALWLLAPPVLHAQSTTHHRKTPSADSDDADSVSPSPSPSPHSRTKHGKDTKNAPPDTPTPAPGKAEAKPSTADEAAPAKAADAAGGGQPKPAPAVTTSIDPGEIADFDAQPEAVRQLLTAALQLAKGNLTYTYGSADPAAGGMDCSGTIYYLLRQRGFGDVPRQASEQYSWVRERSRFYAVLSKKQDTPELAEMRPGDLLFWTGTYNVDRDPPITHTMIYLGRRRKDGHRLMVGSSDGRSYDGQRRNGVSVFDFHLPPARSGDAADAAAAAAPDHSPDFAGYGPIPGMADLNDAVSRQTAAAHAEASASSGKGEDSSKETPGATPKPKHSAHHQGT